ncbi:MAG: hypothetical protein DWQ06_11840 [Calditrichaeota bacterium]|nr:MAG: hypothetical protein DWQ06_11840 [Calditrichota bacterium]
MTFLIVTVFSSLICFAEENSNIDLNNILAKIDSSWNWQQKNIPPYSFEAHSLRILSNFNRQDSSEKFIRLIESYSFNLRDSRTLLRKRTLAYGDTKKKRILDLDFDENMAKLFEYYSRGYIKSPGEIRSKIVSEIPEQNHLTKTLFLDLDILESENTDEIEIGASTIKLPFFAKESNFYSYNFEGIKELDGEKVYEISFKPNNEDKPLLIGTTFWSIEKMQIRLVKAKCNSAVNLPRFVENVFCEIRYEDKNGFAIPCFQEFDAYISFPLFHAIPFFAYTIKATKQIWLYDFEFVKPIEKGESFSFEFPKKVIRLGLGDAGVELAQTGLNIAKGIVKKGFIEQGVADFDSLAGKVETEKITQDFTLPLQLQKLKIQDSGIKFPNPLKSRNLPDYLEYNRVEGVKLGMAVQAYGLPLEEPSSAWRFLFRPLDNFSSKLNLGYGISNESFSYEFQTRKWLNDWHKFSVGFSYFDKLLYEEDPNRRRTLRNSWKTMWFMDDKRDYFRGRGFKFLVQKNFYNLLDIEVEYFSQKETSVRENVYFAVSPFLQAEERQNPEIREGHLKGFKTKLVYLNRDTDRLRQAGIQLSGEWEYTNSDFLNSDFSYSKYTTEFIWWQPTKVNQTFEIESKFGVIKSDGTVPPQKLYDIGGLGFLRSSELKEFTGSLMSVSTFTYNFGGDIFRTLPLPKKIKHSFEFRTFLGFGYTRLRDSEQKEILKLITENPRKGLPNTSIETDGVFKEVGVSFAELAGFFRLDFSMHYDFKGLKPTFESAKVSFGVFKF